MILSSSRNAASRSFDRTTNLFPSSRCASAIQIVRQCMAATGQAIYAKQKPIQAECCRRDGHSLRPERSTDENNSLVTRRSQTAQAAVAKRGACQGPTPQDRGRRRLQLRPLGPSVSKACRTQCGKTCKYLIVFSVLAVMAAYVGSSTAACSTCNFGSISPFYSSAVRWIPRSDR